LDKPYPILILPKFLIYPFLMRTDELADYNWSCSSSNLRFNWCGASNLFVSVKTLHMSEKKKKKKYSVPEKEGFLLLYL